MVLLHFVRWLRANTDVDFEILLLAGGPLAEEFEAVARTHRAEALGSGSFAYLEAGITKAGFPGVANRLKVLRAGRSLGSLGTFDVIYLNSTTSAFALQVLDHESSMLVSHVHELESAFTYWFPERDRTAMLAATDWFVACAGAVKDNLVENFGVAPERVSCHHEFVDVPAADTVRARRIREDLGLPLDVALVGGAGMVIWRKAPDLFVQVAAGVARRHPDIDAHFVWIGGYNDEKLPIEQDLRRLGLSDRVHFVGEVSDTVDLFSELDVFCLTSREDPYPLVMLEAAAAGVPVVAFPNGGVVEFATDDAGRRCAELVPYLDADAMADSVADLLRDADARRDLAANGRDRVRRDHTVEVGASKLFAELSERVLDHCGVPLGSLRPQDPAPDTSENTDAPTAFVSGAGR